MTNLRKAAQAVIEHYDNTTVDTAIEFDTHIEALRQALAEPVEPFMCVECNGKGYDPVPRPVCCQRPDADGDCCGSPEPEWLPCGNCEGFGFVKPPSVDAQIGVDDWIEAKPILFPTTESLIAEAVAKEREECAQIAMDFWCDAGAEAIRARGQK